MFVREGAEKKVNKKGISPRVQEMFPDDEIDDSLYVCDSSEISTNEQPTATADDVIVGNTSFCDQGVVVPSHQEHHSDTVVSAGDGAHTTQSSDRQELDFNLEVADGDGESTGPAGTASASNASLFLTARAVVDEDDSEVLEEEIQQVLQAERENAVVAEAVDTGGDSSERGYSFWSGRGLLLGSVAILLVSVVIVLSVVLPKSKMPTAALVSPELIELLSAASLDGGAALKAPSTPQNQALTWLAGNANLDSYSDEKKVQRYILATLYFSTNGDNWNRNDGWLGDTDECSWANRAYWELCKNGTVTELRLFDNMLLGTIPDEVAMLSHTRTSPFSMVLSSFYPMLSHHYCRLRLHRIPRS